MSRASISMAARIASLGVPPLPVLQDVGSILDFLVNYLDDAAEDAVKVFTLFTVWVFTQQVVRALGVHRTAWAPAISALLLVGVYPVVDEYSDSIGDAMQPIQSVARQLVAGGGTGAREAPGVRPPRPTPEAALSVLARLSDDYVEDTFKAACVVAHGYVASMVQTAILASTSLAASTGPAAPGGGGQTVLQRASRLCISAAAFIIAVGIPAAEYVVSALRHARRRRRRRRRRTCAGPRGHAAARTVWLAARLTMLARACTRTPTWCADRYGKCNAYADALGDIAQGYVNRTF